MTISRHSVIHIQFIHYNNINNEIIIAIFGSIYNNTIFQVNHIVSL